MGQWRGFSFFLLSLCAPCLLSLCLEEPKAAAAEPARPLVVDLTTLTKVPRTELVEAFIAAETPLKPGTYPLISAASPEFMDSYRWLHPSATAPTCPVEVLDLDVRLERMRSLLVELEMDKALELFDEGVLQLPCLTTRQSRDNLRKLYYYAGVAHHFAERADEERRAFLDALAIDPGQQPVEGFPPDVATAFKAVAGELEALAPVRPTVDPQLQQARLTLDGVAYDSTQTLSLLPGAHVAQVFDASGVARTAPFNVAPEDTRPLSGMIDILPPGSASYLNAMLRTSIVNDELTDGQKLALERLIRRNNYSYLFFIVSAPGTPARMRLVSYVPGQGFQDGPPAGLSALPPMATAATAPAPTEGKSGKKPAASGSSTPPRSNTGSTSGGKKNSSKPPALELDRLLHLELAAADYDGVVFTGVVPGVSLRLFGPLGLYTGLYYQNDFGAFDGTPRAIYGLRLGMEATPTVGPVLLRFGLGGAVGPSRVVEQDGVTTLLIEGTPELWLGASLPVGPVLLGLEFAGGYGPGALGEAPTRVMMRGGVVASLPF